MVVDQYRIEKKSPTYNKVLNEAWVDGVFFTSEPILGVKHDMMHSSSTSSSPTTVIMVPFMGNLILI